jgi:ATPase subunit of ABC transporter with duplicated ATPase domains
MNAVLDIRGVTKAYGERAVLRGVDLTVAEHAAVALIGASGSGKSTLLRCIDLLEEIDDGDIFRAPVTMQRWCAPPSAAPPMRSEALVRKHWSAAHRTAFLIVQDAGAAEDIAQETMRAAVRANRDPSVPARLLRRARGAGAPGAVDGVL